MLTSERSVGRNVTFTGFKSWPPTLCVIVQSCNFHRDCWEKLCSTRTSASELRALVRAGGERVHLFDAYFKGLVFHFHDELLLLFLASAGFLQFGLDAVDLHLVFHNCGKHRRVSQVTTSIKKKKSTHISCAAKTEIGMQKTDDNKTLHFREAARKQYASLLAKPREFYSFRSIKKGHKQPG